MAARIHALVNPALLIWAREKAGLSTGEAAHRIGVKEYKVISWERATAKPTIGQARKLAKLYKRPLALFYLATKPTDFKPMLHDYRRLPGQETTVSTNHLLYEVRRAIERRSIALELLQQAGIELTMPSFETINLSDPEGCAAAMRSFLGLSLDNQIKWHSSYRALNAWRASVEAKGILVFQATHVDISEMRGACINDRPLPIILLNSSDSPNGRIFTAIHELVHILLNQSSLCDLREDNRRIPEDREIEVFCNRVAGALLLPRSALLGETHVSSDAGPTWSDEVILSIARKYSVSREVVLRRLLISGKTTEAFYSRKTEEYNQEYLVGRGRGEGFALPHTIVLSRSGEYFTSLVLESYYKERITSSDVSEYLEVKLKHLPKIEESLASRHGIGA